MSDAKQAETSVPTDACEEADYTRATDHLWKTYATINELIRFADAKAGALLTVNGVLIGAALTVLNDKPNLLGITPLIFFLWVVWGLCLLVSTACGLLCIKPILLVKHGSEQPRKDSTIYFDHIAHRANFAAFCSDVLSVQKGEGEFKQIAAQVYAVSKIAVKKHRSISRSVTSLSLALAIGVVLLFLITYTNVPYTGGHT
jgi:hypothetical protein